ncbi:MAG: phosphoribosylanthranilate isomerase [Symploca sp. SIO3C6]|uniref:N-(5'-phosphoribosyl)anthranilate isomerase n=1 Tax=Symploca sp. SIO1C4 TaxID=2607765 RepID=A0A6B3N4V6_9CYAN|nr:phosphoribosylanthranilate isomerase [Symploca sp. SIO3C6]NER26570.1 phosphoribosylanthranilate isomerase [Symploca sp. SIO1C4]NET07421.1 phosphoribosylanthranilate isomerase [Symploca sp. SIO2B6]
MEPTDRPRVKICCISSVEEAKLAIRYGASALGLVSEMPNYSGVVSEALIAQVAGIVPPSVSSFLLTNKHNALEIMAQQRRLGVNTIQICDQLQFSTYEDLRQKLPGIDLVQVIQVTGVEAIEEAVAVAPHVSGLLIDAGNRDLSVTEVVATKPVHNWEISRRIRELVEVPVFLEGRLNPDNVATAIQQVKPFAVNVGEGIRTDGKLDENKLSKFVSQVWAAFS